MSTEKGSTPDASARFMRTPGGTVPGDAARGGGSASPVLSGSVKECANDPVDMLAVMPSTATSWTSHRRWLPAGTELHPTVPAAAADAAADEEEEVEEEEAEEEGGGV
jgi:hypothetical protein